MSSTPKLDPGAYGIVDGVDGEVTLYIAHTCDHTVGYWYAGEEYTHGDREILIHRKCPRCRNAEMVNALK